MNFQIEKVHTFSSFPLILNSYMQQSNNHITLLVQAQKMQKQKHLWIIVSFVLFDSNNQEQKRFEDYRIRANRTPLSIRTPGDTICIHYGKIQR